MNIPELRLKVKKMLDRLNTRELYTILLIIVMGFASFGLGRLSKLQEGKLPIQIEEALSTQTASAASSISSATTPPARPASPKLQRGEGWDLGVVGGRGSTSSSEGRDEHLGAPEAGGQIVASRSGSKYHYPWCSGAQRISEANILWFSSIEEARKAGYTPASNCKGLR